MQITLLSSAISLRHDSFQDRNSVGQHEYQQKYLHREIACNSGGTITETTSETFWAHFELWEIIERSDSVKLMLHFDS